MTREEAVALLERYSNYDGMGIPNLAGCKEAMKVAADALKEVYPELAESEDERIRKEIIDFIQWAEDRGMTRHDYHQAKRPAVWIAYLEKQKYNRMQPVYDNQESFESALDKAWKSYNECGSRTVDSLEDDYIECAHAKGFREGYLFGLEKQKENPKSADSIPSDCTSDAKCEDRWHKVTDSLPDNGRLVLAKDCLGNVLLARYDGENWEVNVYDNEDHYCHNSISKWCEIPSEEQKGQKPVSFYEPYNPDDYEVVMGENTTSLKQKEQKPAEWSEEDEKYLNRVINLWVNDFGEDSDTVKWLKSLRPSWKPSEDELAKKHLDGYCMGREDTLREMKDFVESHFNCENAKKGTPIIPNTQSGTSTLKAEG